ncbi:MAG: TonB family protein [Gemmatimonadaceae bacterium]
MLDTLLETNAARTRRTRGTLMSVMLHGAIVAGAVTLTVHAPVEGRVPDKTPPLIYLNAPNVPAPAQPHTRTTVARPPSAPAPHFPTIRFRDLEVTPSDVVAPAEPFSQPGDDFGPSLPSGGEPGGPIGLSTPSTGAVDERLVDRAPRLIGRAEPPAFPQSLRFGGKGGRVVIQFVVDTSGRAEMAEFKVIESSNPLFSESVRAALPRYRFSPGEAGGRKVRTLVALPFDFTLVR